MIENKLVTITKSNTFNKGWALFEKYNIPVVNTIEPGAKTVSSGEIAQTITFSKSVDIVLKDACLPSNIVNELKWVSSRGVKLRLLAKSQEIIDKYSSLNFTETKVMSTISVNYMAIFGDDKPFYVSISDYYIRTDGAIWILLFSVTNGNRWAILDGATRVVIAEQTPTSVYKSYFDECLRRNIPVDYVVPAEQFTETLCKSIPKHVNLCVSENVKPALLIFGKYYAYTKESVHYFCGDTYRNLRLANDIFTSRLRADTYCCLNGQIKLLNIQDVKVIKRTVFVGLMTDFVAEQFDTSETELHNDYSAEVQNVEYQYTLIPPKFSEGCQLSDIYDPIKDLYGRWSKLQQYKLSEVKNTLSRIISNCDLLSAMDSILSFNKWITDAVYGCKYHGYSASVAQIRQVITDVLDRYLQYFEQVFIKLNSSSSNTMFDKLDDEIRGYRKTIDEKTQLIRQGENVLGNELDIKRLTMEIESLEKIKSNFQAQAVAHNSKALEEYKTRCEQIASGLLVEKVIDDSVGDVIRQNKSNAELFDIFTAQYLISLRQFLQQLLPLAEKLTQIDIPEDYVVYDKNGKRYIVIDSLTEYENTLPIQQKYKLSCLARC